MREGGGGSKKKKRLARLNVNKYIWYYINQVKNTLKLAYFSHLEGQQSPYAKVGTAK